MKRTIAALLALAAAAVTVAPAFAGHDTVTICHATGSSSNPYVVQHPNKSGDVGGHNGHSGDIIPPFWYGFFQYYPGKNWDSEGQEIYNNGCEVEQPTPTPSPTNTPEPTATQEPTATPTDVPTDEPTPTEVPPTEVVITPTLLVQKKCPYEEVGELFLLTGPEGQTAWFGSYQRNPNTGDWAIPNTASQQKCLGWIAVNASEGKIIYRDCNGNYNIVTIPCERGGTCGAYGNN